MDRVRVSAQSTRYTHSSKNVLSPDEAELFELANLAGVTIDQNVFKILVDLLRMNVAPSAIEQMLRQMTQHQKSSRGSSADAPSKRRTAKSGKENRAK